MKKERIEKVIALATKLAEIRKGKRIEPRDVKKKLRIGTTQLKDIERGCNATIKSYLDLIELYGLKIVLVPNTINPEGND